VCWVAKEIKIEKKIIPKLREKRYTTRYPSFFVHDPLFSSASSMNDNVYLLIAKVINKQKGKGVIARTFSFAIGL
jgi:hypothetical protein